MMAVTLWLAWETKKMAKATEGVLMIEGRPCLAFNGFDLKLMPVADLQQGTIGNGLRIALKLGNPGKVFVDYRVQSVVGSCFAKGNLVPTLSNNGGVIFPAGEDLFILPIFSFPPSGGPLPKWAIKFEILFGTEQGAKKKLIGEVQLSMTHYNQQVISWDWVFLQGPEYS